MERDQALKFMNDLLKLMLQKNGSDLFITAGFPPAILTSGTRDLLLSDTVRAHRKLRRAGVVRVDDDARTPVAVHQELG